ncbi:MAG: hypothetical protein KGJ51_00845 [Acidobacteriota bacterium]|nr:hypothetical protein [Acidobacteriota bacterium]
MKMRARTMWVWMAGWSLATASAVVAQGTAATEGWHTLGKEGRGLLGTVTSVSADHFAVRTEKGVRASVYFNANTRIVAQHLPENAAQPVDCMAMAEAGELEGTMQPVKPDAIQRRDVIVAGGRVDAATGQVGAVVIARLDPVCAKQAQQRAKAYGKTWLAGRVTAIEGNRVTLETVMDPEPVSFIVTGATVVQRQGTTTPAGALQAGDRIRVEGMRRGGVFTAKSIAVMGGERFPRPRGGPVLPRGGEPPQ